jgi:hypothetical protein
VQQAPSPSEKDKPIKRSVIKLGVVLVTISALFAGCGESSETPDRDTLTESVPDVPATEDPEVDDETPVTDEVMPDEAGAGEEVGTATVVAETSQGYVAEVTLTWHEVRDVMSESDLYGPCGWQIGSPFTSGNNTFRAARVAVEVTDQTEGDFALEHPLQLALSNDGDEWGGQLACPGGEAPTTIDVYPNQITEFDLLWMGNATPNDPTGFDTDVWNTALMTLAGVTCTPVKADGAAMIDPDRCDFLAALD